MEEEDIDDVITHILDYKTDNSFDEEMLKKIEKKNNVKKSSFEIVYRKIGKELRENNLNLSKFIYLLKLLKILYSKNKKKILLICGINVLLPLFEYLYNIETKDERVNLALNQLVEILNIIFLDENNIKLTEETNFFQILRLLIDKYNEQEIKIFQILLII